MKHFLFVLLCSLLICRPGLMAQETHASNFPTSFIGHWKGQLNWYPAGKAVQSVQMQLIIQALDSPGVYQFKMIYGEADKDIRPYTLKSVDSAQGHWVVDEHNGILLDGFWRGQRFSSVFSVQGSVIIELMWIENGALQIEFLTHAEKPVRESGGQGDSPPARSFSVQGYQRATLYKQPH
jgi:hypothetical protein